MKENSLIPVQFRPFRRYWLIRSDPLNTASLTVRSNVEHRFSRGYQITVFQRLIVAHQRQNWPEDLVTGYLANLVLEFAGRR
jgi:hypothetical protein